MISEYLLDSKTTYFLLLFALKQGGGPGRMGMGGGRQRKHSAAQVMHSLSCKIPTPEVRLTVELALNLVYFPVKTGFY